MQSNISLNGPYSYSNIPLIIVIILLIIAIIVFAWFNLKDKFKKQEKKPVIIIPKNINAIKNKYLKQLAYLANNVSNLTKRKVYNQLSIIIRSFVLEATSVDVLKYSLNEIKLLNIKALTELVMEYYEPEFSKESNADITASINRTKEVIEKWV